MAMSSQPLHNVVNFGSGNLAHTTQAYTPDLAFFDHPSQPAATRSDRIPGCLKPSSKWWSDMPKSHRLFDRVQFKQILSEVNRYMAQSNTRIGFILTDKELVPIRKLAEKGHVEIADSIPWDACGQGEDRPQLTVLLALWYLGMLASDDQQLVMG
ncbi:hypothetical protein NUU61_003017 [Penicillium alfredii]|uniref:Uncharacterized protein n=1 Tax=Penicillium alfredii TaxID=1506179 RepID=A0A9W9FSN7_9EURO|nr:uncharacterized protein NUU61_003017 [Penicillium alfredii]KAJ5105670.1 hypothetical protein NUU61_003017 [Penicillium alfredii]